MWDVSVSVQSGVKKPQLKTKDLSKMLKLINLAVQLVYLQKHAIYMWEDKVLCAQKGKTGQTGQTVIHSREMQLFSYEKVLLPTVGTFQ